MEIRNVEQLESPTVLDSYDTFGSLHLNPVTDGSKYLFINWNMGNVCTYKCSYCSEHCHNGSLGWPDVDQALSIVKKIDEVYKKPPYNKEKIAFELLGGEATVWPGIEKLATEIKNQGNTARLVTNGIRKVSWWEKYGPCFDGGVTLSFHPEFADYRHVSEVCNTLADLGLPAALLILVYPEKWDYCVEAHSYFKENTEFLCLTLQKLTLINDSSAGRELMQSSDCLSDWPYTEDQLDWIKQNSGIFRPAPDSFVPFGLMGYYDSNRKSNMVNTPSPYIYSNNTNSWKGWDCYVGVDTLFLEQNGNIRRDVMCGVAPILGNWKGSPEELEKIVWPTEAVTCPYDSCYCAHDFLARKVRK